MKKIAILSPISWRTPPRHYGPWEQIASNIAEGMVDNGFDVTLFATGDSITRGKLEYICPVPLEENRELDPKCWECLHISHLMERANEFDLIHNNFDFLPLSYSGLIKTPVLTRIHGFSSKRIIPVYKKYNNTNYYVSISDSDRSEELDYISTVYNGIDIDDFQLQSSKKDYLLFFGPIHNDKGTWEAIQISKKSGLKLIISGIIQDQSYFKEKVKPFINGDDIIFTGHSGPNKRNTLLGGAIALLHPINFDEPFGLSVAEAMLCGTPVIAFNRGSMPELINNGKTGFLVDSVESAINCLSSINKIDPEYCRIWAAGKFGKKKMIDNYINVYNQIFSLCS